MKFRSIFKIQSYTNRIKKIQKAITIVNLVKKKYNPIASNKIWRVNDIDFHDIYDTKGYKIFETPLDLTNISWYKDYVSNFEYPIKRFDKIKISKWFDK